MKETTVQYDSKEVWFDELWTQISTEKESMITKRLVELDLYSVKLKDDRRRFKRFQLEKLPDGVEKLWYDDGTEGGRLLICLQTVIARNEKGMFGYQVAEIKV